MESRRPIRFKFDLEKFVHLVAYLAKRVKDFDRLKAMKLLYFIDKYHLIRHGRPILGDVYYRLDYGPVPSLAYNLLKEADDNLPVRLEVLPGKRRFLQYIEVDTTGRYPIYKAREEADLSNFSEEEWESIEAVVRDLGHHTSVHLMELSHRDETHRKTDLMSQIDYRLFFEGEPEASHEAYEVMELEQEDRDFTAGLTGDRISC